MPTSRDVARLAGVSQATVSRAMSSNNSVAPATRAKVLAAMAQLGYAPHAGAQAMKTRRTHTIGVVVADLSNVFYTQLLDELTRALDDSGNRVVIWNTSSSSHTNALEAIRESAIDGVVFTTATSSSVELAAAVDRQSPVVLINREVDGVDCDSVVSDNEGGGAEVADFLVEHGRTNAAFIGGIPDATTSRDRARGFLSRMSDLGHPVPEHLTFQGDFSHDIAAQVARKLLVRATRPSAIFCANDYMAFGALDALRDLEVSPEECWVIGYDDVEMASWESFNLTTVRQPIREMATAGVNMLLERVAQPKLPPRRLSYPSTLLVRKSTPLAGSAP